MILSLGMQNTAFQKYLIATPKDLLWGGAVNSVGSQPIEPGESYPPSNHPVRYVFTPDSGRVLNEYQLIYLIRGKGEFKSKSVPQGVKVQAGDAFLLFPGEWHSYHPDTETGWTEYWIGFNGKFINMLEESGAISRVHPVFHVGIREEILKLYLQAMDVSVSQYSGFQSILYSIAFHLVSSACYYGNNASYNLGDTAQLVQKSRIMMEQADYKIAPETIAAELGISYSKFRKDFKSYVGISPGRFMLKNRINKACELLTNSNASIKSIALKMEFANENNFYAIFHRMVGMTPMQYRSMTRPSGEIRNNG